MVPLSEQSNLFWQSVHVKGDKYVRLNMFVPKGKRRFTPRAERSSSNAADIHQGAAVGNEVKLWPGCGQR